MMRVLAVLVAAALGVFLSGLLCRSVAVRDAAGRLCARGHLLALAQGTGFYEHDVDEENGDDLRSLVIAENLRARSAGEPVRAGDVHHEYDLLRSQFRTEKLFREAMRNSGLSADGLKRTIAGELQGRTWLAKQPSGSGSSTDLEDRDFYTAHRSGFTFPARFRAAHLFLAAPEEAPPDVVEAKQTAIAALSAQLARGADFAQLIAEASEDEATKKRGGDLGFFSSGRMPVEFMDEVAKLKPGETSKPFRSHLGFHIVRLLAMKPAAELLFGEARAEIATALENDRRRGRMEAIAKQLSAAQYVGGTR